MDDVAPWIFFFVALLLLYPIERRKAHEGKFTFWKWVSYSLATTGAAYIAYVPIRAMMNNPIGSLLWWLALLSLVGITLLFWVAHWRLRLLPSRKK